VAVSERIGWKRWLLIGAGLLLASGVGIVGGWVLRGAVDDIFDGGSRSVTLTGRVTSPSESGDADRVCVEYVKTSVRPQANALGMGTASSDVGACGVTAIAVEPGSEVEGTLVLVGDGAAAYTAWTELRVCS
jgi:hypothetical protein